jgi:hypothetical protein
MRSDLRIIYLFNIDFLKLYFTTAITIVQLNNYILRLSPCVWSESSFVSKQKSFCNAIWRSKMAKIDRCKKLVCLLSLLSSSFPSCPFSWNLSISHQCIVPTWWAAKLHDGLSFLRGVEYPFAAHVGGLMLSN